MSELSCPVCGTELSLGVLFADADAQQAFARLAAVSIPLGARVMQYLTLFTPPKTRLTVAKQVKLVLSLLPDLERQAITAKGRDWPVPHPVWAQAIDQMLSARDAGRLELPLKGHGYLFAILVGLADRHEARQEAQQESQRRHPVAGAQPQVAVGIAAVLPAAARDPELLRIEAHAEKAVPMPAELRAKLLSQRRGDASPPLPQESSE